MNYDWIGSVGQKDVAKVFASCPSNVDGKIFTLCFGV